MSVLIFLAIVAIVGYLIFWVFVPLARGALYDPSSPEQADLMAKFADVKEGARCADLGSGDGRVVIALAKDGAEAHGYEVNPLLVLIARRNIRRAGVADRAFIHWRSFWGADLTRFQVITVFQVDFIMSRLERKALHELLPGSRIISHHWKFPTLEPESRRSDIYLYRIP
ncbi:MAG TPA: hypothetical protein VMW73_05895 [Spirochaetia bacterium]|nr:hypothetical protein [Spirochaetia bacterium]